MADDFALLDHQRDRAQHLDAAISRRKDEVLDIRAFADRAIAMVEFLRRITLIDQAAEIVATPRRHDNIDIASRTEAWSERNREVRHALLLAVILVRDDGVDEHVRLELSHALRLRVCDHHDLPFLEALLRLFQALGPMAAHALHFRLATVHGIGERDLAPRRRRFFLFKDQYAEPRAMQAMRDTAAEFAATADDDQMFHRWNLLSL